MKRSLLFAIAVLLVAALFVSCNANKVEEDQLGNVSISGLSRALDATSESSVDVEDLYWYYSATKTSGMFKTGATTWAPVKDGKGLNGAELGNFSIGGWTFCFYGFASEQSSKPSSPTTDAVYYQENLSATVVKGQQTVLAVTLTPGTLPNPLFAVNAVTWKYDLAAKNTQLQLLIYDVTGTTTDPVKTINGTVDSTGTATFTSDSDFVLSAGNHTLNFKVIYPAYENQLVGAGVLEVTAEKGKRYTIINADSYPGLDIVDESGSVIVITGPAATDEDEKTVEDTSVETNFVVDVTPAEATESEPTLQTTVSFPANTLEAGSTYSLTTEVYPLETTAASSAFVVSSNTPTAAAAIDLTLLKGSAPVSSFNNSVTVTTYIAKGLTSVNVVYNDGSTTGDTTDINAGGTEDGKAYVAAILTDAEQAQGNLGYNPNTGYLSFTTTHFSLYAVGAEQNVYERTTNTAYILREDGKLYSKSGEDYTPYTPALTDELVLLDESKANMVDDSIDAFNAGYNWTAITHSTIPAPGFAGGYGTKIEPYIIASREQMQNVSSLYTEKYNYFKVDSSKFTDKTMDCSEWTSVRLYGSFNGDGIVFYNTNTALFASIVGVMTDGSSYSGNAGFYEGTAESFNTAPAITVRDFTVNANMRDASATTTQAGVVRSFGTNITFKNIVVSGYIQGYIAAGIGAFGAYQYGDDSSRNPQYKQFESNVTFDSCTINATLVAVNERAAGLVNHPYCNSSNSTFIVKNTAINSEMYTTCGTTARPETYMYNYQFPAFKVIVDGVVAGHPYQDNEKSHMISADTPALDAPETKGTVFSIDAIANAHHATYALIIAPNPGSMVGTYVSEEVSLVEGKFTSNNVKYCDVRIHSNNEHQSGYIEGSTIYEVYNSAYDGTSNGQFVQVVQYNEAGEILAISKRSLTCVSPN